jgi:uncharacterized damage-inducible protein DinB
MSKSQLLENYLNGVKMVQDAVEGLSPQQLKARPVAGKWSTLEVVCHLADFEPIYADRMKRILSHDKPVLASVDEQKLARLAYNDRDVREELNVIEATRKAFARLLGALPDSALQRTGIYQHEGKDEERTVEKFLTLITNHIPHHVKFVHEKRKALGLPG